MVKLIKDGQILTDDAWTEFTGLEDSDNLPEGDVYVPLEQWAPARDALLKRNCRLGVFLKNTENPTALLNDLDRLDLIVLDFPKMADGRAFTQARLLRDRYGFKGEIRATGDVLRDQIFYMKRCGFNAFELRGDQDAEKALRALGEMTVTYQPATDEELPIWKRPDRTN